MEDRWSPIKAQTPNPEKISCKDCKYRDKTTFGFDGKVYAVGITRDSCDKFKHKPPEVLFLNDECVEYAKE